jgi:hypothetical protein
MMSRLLNNLANATLKKNDTVATLVTKNKKVAKALGNAIPAIAHFCLPPTVTTPAGRSNDHPSHWSLVIPKNQLHSLKLFPLSHSRVIFVTLSCEVTIFNSNFHLVTPQTAGCGLGFPTTSVSRTILQALHSSMYLGLVITRPMCYVSFHYSIHSNTDVADGQPARAK